MQTLTTALAVLVVGSLAAQAPKTPSKTFTSPMGYEKAQAEGVSYLLGFYAEGRMQFADGDLRGYRFSMDRVDFRLDDLRRFRPGPGRSWTRVTLDMAHTDRAKMSSTWSRNHGAGLTRVYDAKTSWPTVSTAVANAQWGQHVPGFAFAKPFVYNGTQDMLFDFRFRGGRMANGYSFWTGNRGNAYYLDGLPYGGRGGRRGSASVRMATETLPSTTAVRTSCADCAFRFGDARTVASVLLNSAGTATVQASVSYAAPFNNVLLGVSYAGSSRGVSIGAKCYPLYLNPAALVRLQTLQTSSGGRVSWSQTQTYDNAWSGASLYFQAFWPDSCIGQLSLSRATRVQLTRTPKPWAKSSVSFWTATSLLGGSPTTNLNLQLLPRITRR